MHAPTKSPRSERPWGGQHFPSASQSRVRPFCCLIRLRFLPAGAALGGPIRLSFRPATTPKWFRWGLVRSRHDEELDDLRVEGIRQLLEDGDGRVFQPTFEAAYIGSIDSGVGGKSLLGEVALDSKSPEIPRHKCLRPHVERRALRSSLNHGL